MRVAAMGPVKGMSDMLSAADAAVMTIVSKGISMSRESGVATTCTSLRKSLGNSGRSCLSVRRAMRMPCVLGRPSRLKKLPGILPLE